ncbi:MAG: thiamine pyrophosphate-dependent enzyme [Deltaproteobacteria bacterium]|nr:thiamine pyrophosphate-dependent enzyme [Deltaproteobacteria bacterium]
MATVNDILQRESCFQPGSTLCKGCMEGISFQNIGKLTDNGKKTIFSLGTFCGEVSTLQFPNPVAWGRGENTPEDWSKSFGVMHHVFESAPSVAEGIRDTADILLQMGALSRPIQVVAISGDGGALSIGLRTLLHTIQRRSRIVIFVLVNEIFANTGFQQSPTTSIGADTSTSPSSEYFPGNLVAPMDYLSLVMAAGAGLVAQVSPAYPKFFYKTVEKALECQETAVIFIPSPCITGWKYEDGETIRLAQLACETGFFPCYIKEKGDNGGTLKFVETDPVKRPPIEEFMGPQRRFQHLVFKNRETGRYEVRPGKEPVLEKIREWIQNQLENLS